MKQKSSVRFLATLLVVVMISVCVAAVRTEETQENQEILREIQINEKGEIVYGPKTEVPEDKLFQGGLAFCEGCYGLVMEVSKLLQKWKAEDGSMKDHIDTASYAACRTDRLKSYVLSPPKMVKLCTGILAHYNEAFTTALLLAYTQHETPSEAQLVTAVCERALPACLPGVVPMSISRAKDRRKRAEAARQDL